MLQRKILVSFDGSHFWERCYDTDTNAEYDQAAVFSEWDKLADGFKWSMSVRGTKQRKHHARSLMTSSIYAMLDNVRAELKKDPGASVVCLTPDLWVEFVVE